MEGVLARSYTIERKVFKGRVNRRRRLREHSAAVAAEDDDGLACPSPKAELAAPDFATETKEPACTWIATSQASASPLLQAFLQPSPQSSPVCKMYCCCHDSQSNPGLQTQSHDAGQRAQQQPAHISSRKEQAAQRHPAPTQPGVGAGPGSTCALAHDPAPLATWLCSAGQQGQDPFPSQFPPNQTPISLLREAPCPQMVLPSYPYSTSDTRL